MVCNGLALLRSSMHQTWSLISVNACDGGRVRQIRSPSAEIGSRGTPAEPSLGRLMSVVCAPLVEVGDVECEMRLVLKEAPFVTPGPTRLDITELLDCA